MYTTLKFLGKRAIQTKPSKFDERERERARSELWNVDRPWKRKKASSSKHPRGYGMGKPTEYPGEKNISRMQ